jgi:hypothetical protein
VFPDDHCPTAAYSLEIFAYSYRVHCLPTRCDERCSDKIHNACDKPDCHKCLTLLWSCSLGSLWLILSSQTPPVSAYYKTVRPLTSTTTVQPIHRVIDIRSVSEQETCFLSLLEDLSFCSKRWYRNQLRANLKHLTQTFPFFFNRFQYSSFWAHFSGVVSFLEIFFKIMCHFLVSTLCSTKSFQFSLFFDFAKIFYPLLYSQRYFFPSSFFSVSETRVKKNHGRRRSNSVEHNYGAI